MLLHRLIKIVNEQNQITVGIQLHLDKYIVSYRFSNLFRTLYCRLNEFYEIKCFLFYRKILLSKYSLYENNSGNVK